MMRRSASRTLDPEAVHRTDPFDYPVMTAIAELSEVDRFRGDVEPAMARS